jgi:ABC-type multidrug transport system ATPase subunit
VSGEPVIALRGVSARTAPLSRGGLTIAWGAGLHAIVGTVADGGPLLLALVAGRERVRAGDLRVLGHTPDDASVRPQIALVALAPPLAEAMRVHEVLSLAASLRGEPERPAVDRLAPLALEALAPRSVRSLSLEEARAVAMAEALTSTRVRVLLLDEPLAGLDPRAAGRLPELLRARAGGGVTVLIATASVRDAGALADDHVLMQAGALVGQATSLDALSTFTPAGVRMRVLASDPQALVAALAREPEIEAVARRDGVVVARGGSARSLAQAVGRAVLGSGVEVIEMRLESPSLDDSRLAVSGIAQGTFEAARARTAAALATPSPTRPPEVAS